MLAREKLFCLEKNNMNVVVMNAFHFDNEVSMRCVSIVVFLSNSPHTESGKHKQ